MTVKLQKLILTVLAAVVAPVLVAQETPTAEGVADVLKGLPYSPNADRGFPTQVLFGDTHVHSALSADAGGGGTTLMPRDMYRFAIFRDQIPKSWRHCATQFPTMKPACRRDTVGSLNHRNRTRCVSGAVGV